MILPFAVSVWYMRWKTGHWTFLKRFFTHIIRLYSTNLVRLVILTSFISLTLLWIVAQSCPWITKVLSARTLLNTNKTLWPREMIDEKQCSSVTNYYWFSFVVRDVKGHALQNSVHCFSSTDKMLGEFIPWRPRVVKNFETPVPWQGSQSPATHRSRWRKQTVQREQTR